MCICVTARRLFAKHINVTRVSSYIKILPGGNGYQSHAKCSFYVYGLYIRDFNLIPPSSNH